MTASMAVEFTPTANLPSSVELSTALQMILDRYGDLVFMERPAHTDDVFSRKHPKMTLLNRARIFAPFAALVGFDQHIRSKDVMYVWKHELDADEEWELNRKLVVLHNLTCNSKVARMNQVRVNVEYFTLCTDPNNDAYGRKGLYKKIEGVVTKVDRIEQAIRVNTGDYVATIPFNDIYSITSNSITGNNIITGDSLFRYTT